MKVAVTNKTYWITRRFLMWCETNHVVSACPDTVVVKVRQIPVYPSGKYQVVEGAVTPVVL
jgi:hypothetical protein